MTLSVSNGFFLKKKTFIPSTSCRKKGQYRLLVLDGHGSLLSAEFDAIYSRNYIVPICMPSHLSHLLQPLGIENGVGMRSFDLESS